MRSVGSHSTSGREKEGIKERMEVVRMHLNQDRDYWRVIVNAALNLWVQ